MVYRCLNCGAATKYDAKIGRMVCDSCCSIWDPALLQAQSIPENEIERKTPEEQQKERSADKFHEENVYGIFHLALELLCMECIACKMANERSVREMNLFHFHLRHLAHF